MYMFEWQRHSQEHNDVPDCEKLLEFIDLRAQAAEATVVEKKPEAATLHLATSPSLFLPSQRALRKQKACALHTKVRNTPCTHALSSDLCRMMKWLTC